MYLSECDKGVDNCYWSEATYDDFYKKYLGLEKNSQNSLIAMRDEGIKTTFFTQNEDEWKCFKDIGRCNCDQKTETIKHCQLKTQTPPKPIPQSNEGSIKIGKVQNELQKTEPASNKKSGNGMLKLGK